MIYQMKTGVNNIWTVYRHISPSGKVYIGITSRNPTYRWNNGNGYLNARKSIFKSTILKYGWNNIKHEVLFTNLTEEKAKSLEIDLIRHYKNLGISLNNTDGGEGTKGLIPWNKGIKLPYIKSNKLRGRKLTKEHKLKLSLAHRGKSTYMKGRTLSEFQRNAVRVAQIGRIKCVDEINKISKALSKSILLYTIDMIFVGKFNSGVEAA